MKKKISIIASFYNEEENINEFISRIKKSFKNLNNIDYELIFIDDFSNDSSNSLIKKACNKNKKIKLITLKKRYGLHEGIQTGFDFVGKKNYATVIDCDLQDPPELIAQNFAKIKKDQTIHFIRKKREDSFFQRFYTKIAYLFLHFISEGKIIRDAGHFKIISPIAVKKIKKNIEAHPYWNYLFTKCSPQNKKVYYIRKKRIHGNSKFNIFTLNPWVTFFSGIHFFRKRFIYIISTLLIINTTILLLNYYSFYNVFITLFLALFSCLLIASLGISTFLLYYKKRIKRTYCKYK